MKMYLLLGSLTLLSLSATAQTFQWAKSTGGSTKDEGISIVADASGNTFSTGSFRGTVDFDPGAGSANLTAVGDNDIFIRKFDRDGNFSWAKSVGSSTYDVGIDIAIDASGNVYTTGAYSGAADFDPGASTTTLTPAGSRDIFITKFDGSGNFIFAVSMGGSSPDAGNSIAVDLSGNIYCTGYYSGIADMDPGAGVNQFESLKAGEDIFLLKLNATGNFLWARTAGGANPDQGTGIALDLSGNPFVTGFYNGDANFNPLGSGAGGIRAAAGGSDIFVLKFDAAGTFGYVKSFGGTGPDVGYGITIDATGNIFTTGYFSATADFDPGAGNASLTSAGTNVDIFVSKLDAAGNYLFAKNMGGTNGDVGYAISVDGPGNIYTYGAFAGTADFDPGAATTSVTSAGLADVYISKLDATGNFVWVKTFGGTTDDIGYSMSMDGVGNIYTTGIFSNTADFDPDAAVFNMTSAGGNDVFNTRLGSAALPISLSGFDVLKKGEDAYLYWKTATELNASHYEIEKGYDGVVFTGIGTIKAEGNSTNSKAYNFNDKAARQNRPNQKIYYRLKMVDVDGRFAYSPIRQINFTGKETAISLFPNPAKTFVTIKLFDYQPGSSYSILNGDGRKLLTGNLNGPATNVDVQILKSGVYYLQVNNELKQTYKIIKQ